MSDYVLYGTPVSPFVRKVEAVLNQIGQTYDFENVDIFNQPDWFKEISPARRVPVLRDRSISEDGPEGTLADSSAICVFLSKKHKSDLYCSEAFDTGRAVWLEEYADTVLAQPAGMNVFRPVLLPRFAGQESDLDTARKTWNEVLPPIFDYLENCLAGGDFFLGNAYSIADIAVGCQMAQLDIVAGLPEENRWPNLARHTSAMKERPGFKENLETCKKMLGKFLPEPVDLS